MGRRVSGDKSLQMEKLHTREGGSHPQHRVHPRGLAPAAISAFLFKSLVGLQNSTGPDSCSLITAQSEAQALGTAQQNPLAVARAPPK